MQDTVISYVKTHTHTIRKNLTFSPELLLIFCKANFFIINPTGHKLDAAHTADRPYLALLLG